MNKKALSILALVFLASACSHIPLSTMVSMSSFDEEDFVAITPENIRVKVRTDKPLSLSDEHVKLEFNIEGPSGRLSEAVSLTKLSQSTHIINKWFGEDRKEYARTFALSEQAVITFKQVQKSKLVRTAAENSKFKFKANISFPDDTPTQLMLTIDLLLKPEKGYFTLFEDVHIDFEEASKKSQ
ncbi:MAG: hypothetical protein CMP47_03195 [Rickettsiales bacterium]|jgi:hypothetical protein|nr:hypothetical protein [Rickettsiales bacterium]